MISHPLRTLTLYSIVAVMAACGGGGGKLGQGGGGGGGGGGNGWQQGVFLNASTFANQCQNSAGTDPFTGQAYGGGSTLDENNFLRSFSDDTYLWYDEITDQNPGLFNDPLDYFEELRTSSLSPSGAPTDKFHFTYGTDEWYQLSQGVSSGSYGVDWAVLETLPPRQILVAYTEPNSPATDALLARGTEILEIDGVDVINGSDIVTLNEGLYPSNDDPHTFLVRDLGSPTTRTVVMTAANVDIAMIQNPKIIDMPDGTRVGYMTFNYHRGPAQEALIDAVDFFNAGAGIDDLVLDIRYNGGGFLDVAAQLAYMIAGPVPTAGRTFEEIQFNDKHPATDPITGQALAPTPFHDETLDLPGSALSGGVPLPNLGLPRVYVLTGGGTCSASEAIMNGLRGVDVEVIQIGTTTCGKPYGFYPQGNCGTHYFTIQFRGVNEKNFGDYTDGFFPGDSMSADMSEVPGCAVADDFTKQLGDPTEDRLATALAYRDAGACPAPATAATQSAISKSATPLSATDGAVYRSPWDSNRIMRP